MKTRKTLICLAALLILSSSCTFNFSLAPPAKPLKERVVEGEGEPKILLMDLSGVISLSKSSSLLGEKGQSLLEKIRGQLAMAEADKDVAGLIIRIDSPGGGVAASDLIYHEIMAFKKEKKVPVYAYIMETGASGAYYDASAADMIVAEPAALVGSIGVIAMKFNAQGLFSKIGIQAETYKSGAKKDFWSPFRPSTPAEQQMLQSIVNGLYGRFLQIVYKGRHGRISMEQLKSLADGRILTAGQALDDKLVDKVGYLDDTFALMKKNLGIKKARLIEYSRAEGGKPNIYSGPATVINLLNLSAEAPAGPSLRFYYLWNP
ncbi:MAG: signal peptide peptidase SppA [Actinomycetota bacterium]|nr:signal peptide peptidase SppA [Actinomycetota bacterium]